MIPDKDNLRSVCQQNTLDNQDYESHNIEVQEILHSALGIDTKYLCELAADLRENDGFKEVPHMLLAVASNRENNEIVREYAPKIIHSDPGSVIEKWEMIYGPVTVEGRADYYLEEYGEMLKFHPTKDVEKLKDGTLETPGYPDLIEKVKSFGKIIPEALTEGIEVAVQENDISMEKKTKELIHYEP